jgi:hypothetical protein
MKITPHNRQRVLRIAPIAAGCLLLAGSGLCGCGTTSHDEYFAIRGIVVEPARGDGTLIASRSDSGDSPRLLADVSHPARGSNSTVLATE